MTTDEKVFAQVNEQPRRHYIPVSFQYVLVYLLVAVTGGLVFQEYGETAILGTFAVCMFAAARYLRKISASFIVYAAVFTSLLLLVHVYTRGSLQLTSVLGTILQLLIAYIVLALTGKDFPRLFVNLITFLAGISLVGYAIDQIRWLDPVVALLPNYIEAAHEGIFYSFGYDIHLDRNISIFFEPAVYQAFVNAALFMIFFVPNATAARWRNPRIGLLVVTLVTTFSTTGYLIFGVLSLLVLVRGRVANRAVLLIGIAGVVSFVVLFTGAVENTLVKKVDLYFSGSSLDEGIELRRKFDVLADIDIFKENIWGRGYAEYHEEFARRSHAFVRPGTLAGSSNGITKTFAVYGVWFGLFLFASMGAFFIKFFRDPLLAIGGFIMVMMFLSSESLALRPFTLCLIVALFLIPSRAKNDASHSPSKRLLEPHYDRPIQ